MCLIYTQFYPRVMLPWTLGVNASSLRVTFSQKWKVGVWGHIRPHVNWCLNPSLTCQSLRRVSPGLECGCSLVLFTRLDGNTHLPGVLKMLLGAGHCAFVSMATLSVTLHLYLFKVIGMPSPINRAKSAELDGSAPQE